MKFEDVVRTICLARCPEPEIISSESTTLAIKTGVLSLAVELRETVPIGLLMDAVRASLQKNHLVFPMIGD